MSITISEQARENQRNRIFAAHDREVMELYKGGMSTSDIAKKFGSKHRQSVIDFLKSRGVTIRSPREGREIYYRKNSVHIDGMTNRQALRWRAIKVLGGKCSNCGCDSFALLEINHLNGKGTIETKLIGSRNFYASIVFGRRTREGLNVLCKVCHAAYHAQLVLGHPTHTVRWLSGLQDSLGVKQA
jgi:hypothetical protein